METYQALHREIPSDYDTLDAMHEMYSWVPSAASVRPSADGLLKKNSNIITILEQYVSLADYIMDTVFHLPIETDPFTGKLMSFVATNTQSSQSKTCVFAPNEYPYGMEKGHHYIMWYPPGKDPSSREAINSDISNALAQLCDEKKFDFCWYENPKMTIPEIFHVQVFWVYLDDL